LQKSRHLLRGVSGTDQDVDVLRHDNVGPELISKLAACFIQRLAEPLACPVTPEECVEQENVNSRGWPGSL
jgi:hypothetical protein